MLQASAAAWAGADRAGLVMLGASVVKVEALLERGGYSMGSGVAIAGTRVVTNCHVTRGAREVHIVRGGLRWLADAQAVRSDLDLCVLRVPTLDAQPVALGDADALQPGQHLHALGFTGGIGLQLSEGAVVALHPHAGSHVVQSDNWFNSGASGGGLFDDNLRLVGLLTFRRRDGGAHYYSAPAEWIKPLLNDGPWDQPIQPQTALQTLAYWELPSSLRPDFLGPAGPGSVAPAPAPAVAPSPSPR